MLRFHWDAYTMPRLVLPLILGIALWLRYPHAVSSALCWAAILAGLMCVALWYYVPALYRRYAWQYLFGVAANGCLVALGYAITAQHYELAQPDHFAHRLDSAAFALVQLTEPMRPTDKTYAAPAQITAIADSNQQWSAAKGKLMIYLKKDTTAQQLQYGDVLLVSTHNLQAVQPPDNPFGFDYAQYLAKQNIYHQLYATATDWRALPINHANPIYQQIYRLRNYCLQSIASYVGNNTEASVTAALLLGYRYLLPRDVVQTYSATGVTHILAVSGLHVGIIALMGMWLLGFLERRGGVWGRWLRFMLLVAGIWVFILLSGAPPSAARSGVMLTFLLLSQTITRYANFYNLMAGSALLLLLINPYNLTDLGFQLSYLAVGGIVFFQPYIYRLYAASNPVIQLIWQSFSVSLAAQLSTLPLILLYFQQFPTYFLLANLIAVPLSSLILYVGTLFFAVAWIPQAGIFLGKILYALVWLLDLFLLGIEALPFANIKGLVINNGQMVLLYGLMLAFTYYLLTTSVRYLQASLLLLLAVLGLHTYHTYHQQQLRGITAFALNKKNVWSFTDQQNNLILTSDTLTTDEQSFVLQPYQKQLQTKQNLQIYRTNLDTTCLQHPTIAHLAYNKYGVQFYDKTMLSLPNAALTDTLLAEPLHVNYLFLQYNALNNINQLPTKLQFDTLIIDLTNNYTHSQRWVAQCEEQHIPYYNMRTDGAWSLFF